MASVSLATEDLFAHRPANVSRMLSPLRGAPVACQAYSFKVGQSRVIAAHGGATNPESYFGDWRFPTLARDIQAQYYERWRLVDRDRRADLDRAYLHVYRVNREKHALEELLCIHTDPLDETNDALLRYCKRSLHLHVTRADEPLPKCHFALNISHIRDHVEQLLSSPDTLTAAFGKAIELIRFEVLGRFGA